MLSRSFLTLTKPRTLLLASSALALAYIAPSFTTTIGSSASRNMSRLPDSAFPVQKTEEEWRLQLSPEQFRVIREQGTERAGTGEYDKHFAKKGVYECVGCNAPLYTADMKFQSGCGWPAFFESVPGALKRNVDRTYGMERIETVCANCGSHQGHVFRGEGYKHTPADERHCVNSVSIKFNPDSDLKWDGGKK